MPPVSSSGSRAGLVTAVVVFTILFVTATIFAIYFNVQERKAEDDLTTITGKYKNLIADASLVSPEVGALNDLKNDDTLSARFSVNKSMKTWDVLLAERDTLAGLVAGPGKTAPDAASAAQTSLTNAVTRLKGANVALPTNNLSAAVDTLTGAVATSQDKIANLNSQVKDAEQKALNTINDAKKQVDAKDQQIAALRADAEKASAGIETNRGATNQRVADIEKAQQDERKQAQEALQKLQVTLDTRNGEIQKINNDLAAVRNRLAARRLDVTDPILRQSDGQIVRTAGNNTVYINLGSGDQITPGMTFEVYDKTEGIPSSKEPAQTTPSPAVAVAAGGAAAVATAAPGADEAPMPVGKASIEVTHVGATSSECRVVHQQPGTALTEGDLITNLVYDRNTKYKFMVFGKFDLDQNGVATPQDAEVIKRLITQWGGTLTDQVNVDTDFIVLGQEPTLPNFSREELQDSFNAKKLADAQAELDAFLDVQTKARDLHIPILNQNRFLYFVGYYDQAKR